jgi:hypothetical protein
LHPHMALRLDECVELTHLKQKTTVVIPTGPSHINCLLWSVFSWLLRSKINGYMEHFCVCIAGPDERTGDPSLQDEKQRFLEELRDLEWTQGDQRRQMPLTVIRVWSRVGYTEVFEMALGWIHTADYLITHDDVIVTNPAWENVVYDALYAEDDIALAAVPPLLGCQTDHAIHRGMFLLRFPQVQTTFLACKKKWVLPCGSWCGYHVPNDDNVVQFDVEEIGGEEFLEYWKSRGLMEKPVLTNEMYNFVRQEVGSWIHYRLTEQGKKFAALPRNLIVHIEGMSRPTDDAQKLRVQNFQDEIEALEAEIMAHPEYSKLYMKYKKDF